MFVVYAAMILWIIVYFKVNEIQYLYDFFGRECATDNAKQRFGSSTGCINFQTLGISAIASNDLTYIYVFFCIIMCVFFRQAYGLRVSRAFVEKLLKVFALIIYKRPRACIWCP